MFYKVGMKAYLLIVSEEDGVLHSSVLMDESGVGNNSDKARSGAKGKAKAKVEADSGEDEDAGEEEEPQEEDEGGDESEIEDIAPVPGKSEYELRKEKNCAELKELLAGVKARYPIDNVEEPKEVKEKARRKKAPVEENGPRRESARLKQCVR
jgi:hypothetical protein